MNAHFLRGRLLLGQKRFEQAAAELRLALAESPDDANVHCSLGMALLQSDRWQEASELVKAAVAKSPDNSYVHWVMTLVWLDRGHFKEAEVSIREAIELDPDDANHHGLLARVLLERERPQEALAAAENGLSLDPQDDLSLTFRARALMALGRDAEARAVAETLLSEDPEDAWNHCLRGDQLLTGGNPQEARFHYLEALRLDPGMESAREGFATTLKSRSPVYAVLLKALLWTSKLSGWALGGAVILTVVALQFGDVWAKKHPDWLVAYELTKAALWAGVVLIVIANPIFNVLLRFDPEGRRALSEDERRATNWHLVCFGLAALCAVWALAANSSGLPKQLGFGFLCLTQAVTQTFLAKAGYVRSRMAIITRAAAGCLILTPVIGFVGIVSALANQNPQGLKASLHSSVLFPLIAILLSAYSGDLRQWFEKRRPDRD